MHDHSLPESRAFSKQKKKKKKGPQLTLLFVELTNRWRRRILKKRRMTVSPEEMWGRGWREDCPGFCPVVMRSTSVSAGSIHSRKKLVVNFECRPELT